MEFSADTKSLAEALDQVQEAVEMKSTIPILSHVLVEASPSGLRFGATDLEFAAAWFERSIHSRASSVDASWKPLLTSRVKLGEIFRESGGTHIHCGVGRERGASRAGDRVRHVSDVFR